MSVPKLAHLIKRDRLTKAVFEGKEKANEVATATAVKIMEGADEKRAAVATHIEVMGTKTAV